MSNRTIKDKNEIIYYDDYAEILLYDRQGKEIARTKIDLEDVDIIKNYKWGLSGCRYAITTVDGGNKVILMHRLLMHPKDSEEIDHIFNDTLDNRKSQLRVCTHQQNMMNCKLAKNNTSGVTGVTWFKPRKRWVAQIKVNYNNICLGYFKDFDDAVKARKEAEVKYFGEFQNKQREGVDCVY